MWYNVLSLKSFVISSSLQLNQQSDITLLLLDFSCRKDLVHYAAQILLTPVTPELFRHSAAYIVLPLA